MALLAPNTLLQHRYLIIRQIGQGGMGAVYEAIDQHLGNTVALKQLLGDGELLRRAFEREAKLLSRLRHSGLPHVIDYFFVDRDQFLVMEFIPGDDLATLMARRSEPFPVDMVLDWADQLLAVLEYLHAQQPPVVHRDIKPQNLKLMPQGEIILLDFGLSKGHEHITHQTSGKSFVGFTLAYAPLEQIQGSGTDIRSDLFSLAATLHYLLIGKRPIDALTRTAAIVRGDADPQQPTHQLRPELPASIGNLLFQALSLAPDQRPSSATAMRAALRTDQEFKRVAPRIRSTSSKRAQSPAVQLARMSTQPQLSQQTQTNRHKVLLLGIGIIATAGSLIMGYSFLYPLTYSAGPATLSPAIVVQTTVTSIAPLVALPTSTAPSTIAAAPTPALMVGQQVRIKPPFARDLWTSRTDGKRLIERPKLYGGALVIILAIEPTAVHVRTAEGIEGWLHEQAAEALTSDMSATGASARLTAGVRVEVVWPHGIPLRQKPTSSSRKLRELVKMGTQATLEELRGDWLLVRFDDGLSGWIRWYYDGSLYVDLAPGD